MDQSTERENSKEVQFRKNKMKSVMETRGRSRKLTKKPSEEGTVIKEQESRLIKNTTLATKKSGTVRGKKNGKQIPPAVLDAVFGNLQSCVADVDELRKKRDEDALKCGRIPRTVAKVPNNAADPQRSAQSADTSVPKDVNDDDANAPLNAEDSTTPFPAIKGK